MSGKYSDREDIARKYVDGVKECNSQPSWDLLQTAVLYGMQCERDMRDEFMRADRQFGEEKRLGAKIGDIVKIIERGSGCYNGDFNIALEHIITDIQWTGHVEFDNGEAVMYRPKVEVIKTKE